MRICEGAVADGVESNNPSISCTVVFCACAGFEAGVEEVDESPKSWARRSWLFWDAPTPFVVGVAGTSSAPRRSPWIETGVRFR